MFKSKCEWCGKEKEYKYKSQIKRFCSHKCSNNYKWEKIRHRKQYITMMCQICKKEFKIYANDYRVKEGKNIYCSKKCSNEASKKGNIVKCKYCNKKFYSTRNDFCSKKCVYEYKKKNYIHRPYDEGDYKAIYIEGYNKRGNAKLHRYIMEQYLGRKLTNNEVVHHIDGNKQNNNINNLKVMTRGEHSRLHRLEEIKNGKKLFGKH